MVYEMSDEWELRVSLCQAVWEMIALVLHLLRIKVMGPKTRNGLDIRCVEYKHSLVHGNRLVGVVQHVINTSQTQQYPGFKRELLTVQGPLRQVEQLLAWCWIKKQTALTWPP